MSELSLLVGEHFWHCDSRVVTSTPPAGAICVFAGEGRSLQLVSPMSAHERATHRVRSFHREPRRR